MNLLLRLLSFLWPIRVERAQGKHGPLDITWENGRLVLNSARANQSFGGLHRVWQRSFASVRLKERTVDRVLMLGLGAGSVIHILRKEMGINAPIVAVDDDPEMVRIAREHFRLGEHADVEVIVEDAFSALGRITGPFDLIAVDLFVEMDLPKALLDGLTIDRLVALLSPHGILMINTIAHDGESAGQVERLKALLEAIRPVRVLRPLTVNHVLVVEA